MKKTFAIYGVKGRMSAGHLDFTHDHNICLIHHGEIIEYLQLERYTQQKHDNRLDLYIEDIIENELQLKDEFDVVFVNSFEGNSFISKNGRLKFESKVAFPFPPISVSDCFSKFQLNSDKSYEPQSYLLSHELAHIFSNIPFHGMFKENSLLVHFDGGASVSNFSAFTFQRNQLIFVEANWDLSYLSKFFNDNALNFAILGAERWEHISVPGKLMGFSSYGTYSYEIEEWLVQNDYFKDIWDDLSIFFKKAKERFNIEMNEFDTKNNFLQNIVATFQGIFTREIILKLDLLQKKTQTEYLFYSGGSALNIIANSQIIEQKLFRDIFIPPSCNDSGLSVGAAAWLEWTKGNIFKHHNPYLNNVAMDFLPVIQYSPKLIIRTAELLLQHKVVGIVIGNGEIGPRALGNRSIFALPNSISLSKKVSQICKKREWYRPIAPVMLKKVAEIVTGKKMHHLSKYMLLEYEILPKYKKYLEGVVHVNGTARIQTIENKIEHSVLFELLTYLWEEHGIYGLINTSFNQKGMPIVHTKLEAIKTAKNMNLDAIIIENKLKEL